MCHVMQRKQDSWLKTPKRRARQKAFDAPPNPVEDARQGHRGPCAAHCGIV